MLGGGINNIDIINASQRGARDKLNQMAGIKGSPSGILASSPELMQAVTGAAPAMPVRATGPATPMAPAPMPMAQPVLPQVPAPTAIAAAPVQQPVQQAPAPAPAVPQPAAPTTPMKFQPGGPVTLNEQFRGYSEMGERLAKKAKESNSMVVDITQDPVAFLEQMDAETGGAVTNTFGSIDKALQEGTGKANSINAALDTGSAENVANTVIDQAGLPLNDDSKKEFASSVLGIDTDDIGEIDDAIFRTLTADVTLSGKELQKAVLLGLQNYKQTAAARAEAAADAAGGFLDTERGKAAVEIYIEQIKNNVPPSEVEQMMNAEMGGNIGTKVRQSITGSVTGGQQSPESLLAEARSVIERGAKRSEVEDRLREMGVDPGRL